MKKHTNKTEDKIKVVPLNELKDSRKYSSDWFFDAGKKTLESKMEFGKITQIAIVENDKVLWDQYMIEEKEGVIIVPYLAMHNNYYLGLIKHYREIPSTSNNKKQGLDFWEFPRGFKEETDKTIEDTVIRELYEETSLSPKSIERIGYLNPNTAFYKTSIAVFKVVVNPTRNRRNTRNKRKKTLEEAQVRKFKFFPLREAYGKLIKMNNKNNYKVCDALSLAALQLFIYSEREIILKISPPEELF